LTKDELEEIIDAHNVSAFLNTRHAVFKAKGWKEKPPTKPQAIADILKDNKVMLRPIIKIGERYIVEFDKEAYGKIK